MSMILLDFDDSFTYNIASELSLLGLDCQVVHWSNHCAVFHQLQTSQLASALILGPGPGHPDEYQEILPELRKLIGSERISILGICLGHQLLARMMGVEVVKSSLPLHGQSVDFAVPAWLDQEFAGKTLQVQRYNSLTFFGRGMPADWQWSGNSDGEVMIMRHKNLLSYQFHPESVGTSYREIFFKPLLTSLV